MDRDDLILDARTRVSLDRPADLASNWGHESLILLRDRTRGLARDHVMVAQLEPTEELHVRPGGYVRFLDAEGRWQVLDVVPDEARGKLAIFGRVADGWADAVGYGMEFMAAEPDAIPDDETR